MQCSANTDSSLGDNTNLKIIDNSNIEIKYFFQVQVKRLKEGKDNTSATKGI